MTNTESCIGCKFLYLQDMGYSNYTVTDTEVRCAKGNNSNLPSLEPCNWNWNAENDNWPDTNSSRCDIYAHGELVHLDVDGDDSPSDFTSDSEAIAAICADAGCCC